MPQKFEAQYAKSSQSTCCICKARIPEGALRIGHLRKAADKSSKIRRIGDSRMTRCLAAIATATKWYHFECFSKIKGVKSGWSNIPDDGDDCEGVAKLKKADQNRIRSMFKAIHGTFLAYSKHKTGDRSSSSEPAKKRPTKAEATLANLTKVRGVLKTKEFQAIQKAETALTSCTLAQLEAELVQNQQVKTGKKEELIHRIAEGRVLGALPSCPKCKKARIKWSRVGGIYSCPGYNDKGVPRRCTFKEKDFGPVKRKKWKIDPSL